MLATIRAMPTFDHVYTDQQREALATAYEDRRVRPAARVAELAAAGELTLDGDKLAPFATTENTVRDCARKLRNRRAGELKSSLATLPPRDAVEVLRRRLISLADRELSVLEHSRRGKVQIERLRQIVRVVREASALPGPDDPRPAQPGQRKPGTGEHEGGRTSGGMAAAILGAASQSARVETHQTQPAPDVTPPHPGQGTQGPGTQHAAQDTEHTEPDAPGAWAREQVAAPPL
jgi:hypothetical protein